MMKPNLTALDSFRTFNSLIQRNPLPFPRPSNPLFNHSISVIHHSSKPSRFLPICLSNPTKQSNSSSEISSLSNAELVGSSNESLGEDELERNLGVQVGNPFVPSYIPPYTKLSLSDQALFLLSFIACTVWTFSIFSFGFWGILRFMALNSDVGIYISDEFLWSIFYFIFHSSYK